MLPRFFVTLPFTGAFDGQVVSFVGLMPSVVALAESVGAAVGAVLDMADGDADMAGDGAVWGVADIAGEGAMVSSVFLPQLERAIAVETIQAESAQNRATERAVE